MQFDLMPKVHASAKDGTLSAMQRLRLSLALMLARRRRPPRPVAGGKRFDEASFWRALDEPATMAGTEALAQARAHQPAWLLNHSLRTWAWAQALAVAGDLRPDHETLFAACMLHDMGLTPAADRPAMHCFAVRGARFAKQVLAGTAPPENVERIAEAIARHLDLQVSAADGVEAHLVQAGAMVDVIGRGLSRVPPAVQSRVLSRYPRLGAKSELCRCMLVEAAAARHTRAHFYVRRIKFVELIQGAPFDG